MSNDCFIAVTYFDLDIKNLNIPFMCWGNFSTLEEAIEYVKYVRKKKIDTLFGAWDIYHEYYNGLISWRYIEPVYHFSPRKDHDFFGDKITDLKIANVVMN